MSNSDSKLEATAVNRSWMLELSKSLIAAVIALIVSTWTVRGAVADFDRRVTVLEIQTTEIQKTDSDAIQEIRTDLRDLRSQVAGERGR